MVIWEQKDAWATLEKRYASHQLTMNQNMSVTQLIRIVSIGLLSKLALGNRELTPSTVKPSTFLLDHI